MKDTKFFNVEMSGAELRQAFRAAERIRSKDMLPDWFELDCDSDEQCLEDIGATDDCGNELRYWFNTSWAYVSAENQEQYFEELDALGELPGVIVVGDDGDGCVHHVYLLETSDWEK